MADDPNIGRIITDRELSKSDEFFELPGTDMRVFPSYSGDGSLSNKPVIVCKVDGKWRTYEVERVDSLMGKYRPNLTILRQVGEDQDGN